ncbi:hypothetical protein RRF57_003561 [Xylaria bambusicola]|uniref:FMN hydroxy acid dehydrogenase domain-containing protein n=1 Tax=Xylaria bambusicola TaxID=326684 RepID=A0AAN7Z7Q7_9PEZI
MAEMVFHIYLTRSRYYASSNAGLSWTHYANRQAFYRHQIRAEDANRHTVPRHGNYHEHGAGDLGLADEAFTKQFKGLGLDAGKEPKDATLVDGKLAPNQRRETVCSQGAAKRGRYAEGGQDGVNGIVVSNHAGRQVDGAIASLDALEKIVGAVGDKTYVMFDSGIRGGADVFKALALGAKFVFIGRLWVYALGSGGEGVRHVMKGLLADFDILMNVAGYPDLSGINRDALDSVPRGAYFPSTQEMA